MLSILDLENASGL